jgi:hypothetical protein
MNEKQRKLYLHLWQNACKVNGWDARDKEQRHLITMDAVGKESAAKLGNSEISALFDHLRWLGDRASLAAAMPVANPQLGEIAHRRRQLVWRINQVAATAGFNEVYVQTAAEEKCAKHKVGTWMELPIMELLKLSFTIEVRARVKRRKSGQD